MILSEWLCVLADKKNMFIKDFSMHIWNFIFQSTPMKNLPSFHTKPLLKFKYFQSPLFENLAWASVYVLIYSLCSYINNFLLALSVLIVKPTFIPLILYHHPLIQMFKTSWDLIDTSRKDFPKQSNVILVKCIRLPQKLVPVKISS